MQAPNADQSDIDYRSLAEFRYQLRCFLRISEVAARAAGLEPQQHQLLLCVRGLPEDELPSISTLSLRLQLKHHTVVELVDRLATKDLVLRQRDELDQRRVLVRLAPAGEALLETLSRFHQRELRALAPALIAALASIVNAGAMAHSAET